MGKERRFIRGAFFDFSYNVKLLKSLVVVQSVICNALDTIQLQWSYSHNLHYVK